jgi:tRNA/rRNA methyltransferase/tRNA (cytidine32/uridine32-2'-O)-methyltransferase
MTLDDIVIVLARPSEPGNTGAVCRAMKNMGLSRLRIAAPNYCADPGGPAGGPGGEGGLNRDLRGLPQGAELERLLARAVHAEEIWKGAGIFPKLEEALADCAITVGTTRRRGKHRKNVTMAPDELAAFLKDKKGRAAIVFGNERTGLEDGELELCTLASHIPVAPEFPSLNLSHAVQVYAYELFKNLGGSGNPKGWSAGGRGSKGCETGEGEGNAPPLNDVLGQWVPMTSAESAALAKRVSGSLEKLGFYKHPGREEQELFLRDLFARAGLTLSEGRYLGNVIAKAARLAKEGPKRRTAD